VDFCGIPVAGAVCDVADAIDFVADPGAAITEGIGAWIAKSCGELAASAADLAARAVNATTGIDLNASWFRGNYELLLPIGLLVLVATFCAQLVRAAVRRDGQALRQAFTGTASGVLFAFSAIAVTTVAIEVVDALSDGLFAAAGTSLEDAVRRMVSINAIGALGPLGWLVMAFAAVGAAIGAFLFWAVMMVRKVGILVLVTLAVFAGAGGGWEVTRRWRRGWIEATATLVVSKLLMTVIFLLGVSAMGQADPSESDGLVALADVMSGIVILVLVLLCPYATFKFVHWAAEGSNGEDIHRAGGAGASLARQHTERAGRKAFAMAATAGTGAAVAGTATVAAPQGPATVPGQGSAGVRAANPSGGHDSGPGPSDPLHKASGQPAPASPGQPDTAQGGHSGGPRGSSPAPTIGGWLTTTARDPAPPPSAPGTSSAPNPAAGKPSSPSGPPPVPPAGS
jgi:hypothetical protein